jgi:hypothetical protein
VIALITAALKWDPTIRGILFPAIQFIILCGASYMILSTNVGNRLGFLLANAAFWGWMALMCIVWLIYGIGLKGKDPSWKGQEAITNIADAQFDKLRALGKAEGVVPSLVPLTEKQAEAAAKKPARTIAGWREIKDGTPTRGEASSATDAYVKKKVAAGGAALFPEKGGPFYKSVAAWDTGGAQFIKLRPRLETGGKWYNPADYRFMGLLHKPRHYVEVLQPYKLNSKNEPILDAKQKPILDEKAKPIFVHSIRDLGNKRRPAWLILFASLILLLISVTTLHARDKQLMAYRSKAKAA